MNKGKITPAQVTIPETSITTVTSSEADALFFRHLESVNICLNEKQIEAVRSIHPRLKVVAGAGCGKSICIVARVAYLVDVRGVVPSEILVISYTRKASQELKVRLDKLVCSSNIVVTTIHGFCYRLLRANGFGKHSLLTDDTHKKSIIKGILRQLDYGEDYVPDSVLLAYSLTKNSMELNTAASDNLPLLRIFYAYDKYKEERNFIDFDDILSKTFELLSEQPQLCYQLQHRFRHILVDEIQDICPLENHILSLLIGINDLCVVGDPRQTIFSFRGSDIKIISDFEKRYPDCHVISLDTNYRSTTAIIGLSNQIMSSYHYLLTARTTEGTVRLIQPKDANAEAVDIANHITQRVSSGDYRYKDFAVIYRASSCSSFVFDEFVQRDIPFTVFGGSPSLYNNGIVKFITAHMRLAIDPGCMEAISTILPTLYISKAAALDFLKHGRPSQDYLTALSNMPSLKEWQYGLICDKRKLIRFIVNMSPVQAVETLINDKQLKKFITPDNQQANTEDHDDVIPALKASIARFDSTPEFLAFVDKAACCARNPRTDAVTLSSIHSAKGLEFQTVFLINAIDGIIPHQRAIDQGLSANPVTANMDLEEERRLLYVAVTRAADELIISVPKEHHGRLTHITRYLKDII